MMSTLAGVQPFALVAARTQPWRSGRAMQRLMGEFQLGANCGFRHGEIAECFGEMACWVLAGVPHRITTPQNVAKTPSLGKLGTRSCSRVN